MLGAWRRRASGVYAHGRQRAQLLRPHGAVRVVRGSRGSESLPLPRRVRAARRQGRPGAGPKMRGHPQHRPHAAVRAAVVHVEHPGAPESDRGWRVPHGGGVPGPGSRRCCSRAPGGPGVRHGESLPGHGVAGRRAVRGAGDPGRLRAGGGRAQQRVRQHLWAGRQVSVRAEEPQRGRPPVGGAHPGPRAGADGGGAGAVVQRVLPRVRESRVPGAPRVPVHTRCRARRRAYCR